MPYEFAETTKKDLKKATDFIHYIRPTLVDKIVYAIEKSKPLDMNVIFHLKSTKEDNVEIQTDNRSILMLSAEYIIEHTYWKR